MLEFAEAPEVRLALLALFSVAEEVPPAVCARVLDDATAATGSLDATLLGGATPRANFAARIGAARLLNSLCAACGACARGQGRESERVTEPAPRAA